jgi:hypothetical protein
VLAQQGKVAAHAILDDTRADHLRNASSLALHGAAAARGTILPVSP